jgi:large subunit ribosomal protein L6
MSRLGKVPVELPSNVKAFVDKDLFRVEGPKGKLSMKIPTGVDVAIDKNLITTRRHSDIADHKAKHGLIRQLVNNMVKGVSQGYEKRLEIVGVGFKAALKGKILNMNLGFSHQIDFPIPEGIEIKLDGATKITVSSPDKALVGETAAKIRGFRPPEPYQGKGVRYSDEVVRRKAGKAAGSK